MTVSNQQEYKLDNGQTISIQFDEGKMKWEVACWNKDDTSQWYKEYDWNQFEAAFKEFERWRK